MENKINVAELLKDCPRGMELDCTMYDGITLLGVDDMENTIFPIRVLRKDGCSIALTKYGQYADADYAKCVIYPKGKTTWDEFVPPYKFKDGDILFVKSTYSWILIYKESKNDGDLYNYVGISDYPNTFMIYDCNPICRKKEVSEIRLATEEERQKLFDAIKSHGYKWNPETKTLETLPKFKVGDRIKHKVNTIWVCTIKRVEDRYYVYGHPTCYTLPFDKQDEYELVPKKFDINTLRPFESRVLVRDHKLQKWYPAMWGYYDFDSQDYPHKLIGGVARYCIPYEGNEHLLGTANDCDDFYKTWE